MPGCAPWFSGYAPDGSELPDGRYTLTIEGTTEGDGFADGQAQSDGVFRVQLGEASGVRAG